MPRHAHRRHAHPRRRLRVPWLVAVVLGAGLAVGLARPFAGPAGAAPGPLGEVLGNQARLPIAAGATIERTLPVARAPRPRPLALRLGEPPVPTAPELLTGYQWPLAKGRLTLRYGPLIGGGRVVDGRNFHDGIDLATFCGDRILAAHDGVVLAAGRQFDDVMGWVGDLGPYYRILDARSSWSNLPIVVVIDDGNGYRSVYAHLGKVTVKTGQRVRAGKLIGYEGATGHASGCHLHYSLFSPHEVATMGVRPDILKSLRVPPRQIARIDPMAVLPLGPAVNKSRRVPTPAELRAAAEINRPGGSGAR